MVFPFLVSIPSDWLASSKNQHCWLSTTKKALNDDQTLFDGFWAQDYVAETGMAQSELVNNRSMSFLDGYTGTAWLHLCSIGR